MRKIALTLFFMTLLPYAAGAATTSTGAGTGIIDAGSSADAQTLAQTQVDLNIKIIGPCKKQTIQTMLSQGKTRDDIMAVATQKGDMLGAQCICQNKAALTQQVNGMNAIITKHPDWAGQIVSVKMPNNGQHIFSSAALQELQTSLSQCH